MDNMPKRGRGRPKGATSTVEMTLGDLINELDGDLKAVVAVGRVWLAKRTPASSSSEPEQQESSKAEAEPKIEFTIS
jgi:hypothetical protein